MLIFQSVVSTFGEVSTSSSFFSNVDVSVTGLNFSIDSSFSVAIVNLILCSVVSGVFVSSLDTVCRWYLFL